MPAALFGPASPAAASLRSAQANDLPSDSINVRIAMTENDGNDVIVAASGGPVSAPGVSSAAAVLFQPTAGGPGPS